MAKRARRQLQRRRRTRYNREQYKLLIEAFEENQYPGTGVREELARLTQIPESRIQVWFQNQRARKLKRSQRNSGQEAARAQVPVPGPAQPGVFACNYSGQEGLLGTLREMDHFGELEHAPGQALLSGHTVVLDVETPACMQDEPSAGLISTLFSPPASQQSFSQLDAGGAGTQVCLEAPELLPPGKWVLHGLEPYHCSGELQPGVASGCVEPWEQPALSPPQQFCLHPASFPLLWSQSQPMTECQEQLIPPSGDLLGALECPACTASCCCCSKMT